MSALGKGKIRTIEKDAKALRLVSDMWYGHEWEWRTYAAIKEEALDEGWSKSSVSRYLSYLVKTGGLDVKFGHEGLPKSRKRQFKPTKDYCDKYFQWTPTVRNPDDIQYIRMINFVTEISKTFLNASHRVVKQSYAKKSVGGLSKRNKAKLNAKILKLIRTAEFDLAQRVDERRKQRAVQDFLQEKVIEVVKEYLDLWAFISTTKGAQEEFSIRTKTLRETLQQLK